MPETPITKPADRSLISCQYTNKINSNGYFFGQNPFEYNAPVLMAEIAFIFLFTRTIELLLRPFNQTSIIAQIVAGILMGPSFLGRITIYNQSLFPLRVRYVLRTFAEYGLMIHLFLLGVQMDVGLIRHIGKRALIIGVSSTLMPFAVGFLTFFIINQNQPFDADMVGGIPLMLGLTAFTSFIVITNLLTDLNMLNSDLGRLASSSSMVSNSIGWGYGTIATLNDQIQNKATFRPVKTILSLVSYYGIMIFLLRPFIIWIASQTPEGKPMKESHFVAIICLVMGFGFLGELIGQRATVAGFLLGLCLPDGPTIGSLLVQKLHIIASGVLLPIFCAMSGFRMNIDSLAQNATGEMQLIMVMGFLGKFIGTFLPSICFGIPLFKAVSLAFIMCCRGIMEMVVICMWRDEKAITGQQISILLANMVIVTGIATPIVVYLYDPSRRYMSYSRRTILKSKQNHLRILVCVNKEENVSPLINLLEVSNPTTSKPITAFVMQLLELKGSASAFLKPTHRQTKSSMDSAEHITNAFNQFQQRYDESVVVQHFTTIAPYASMHDDICNLALDKKTDILIIPFHKTWDVSGMIESIDPSIRALNRNIVYKAPCSVGILVDRGLMGRNIPLLVTRSTFHIVVLFIGGDDDREAIAYSKRMAEHPNVSMTVVCFVSMHDSNTSNTEGMDLDNDVINELRSGVLGKKVIYKEEVVKDGMGTIKVIQKLKDKVDLFIVGKHHDPDSKIMLGLSEWNDNPELGILGDILLNSDDNFSVLLVQQQPERIG